ncbi:SGNH/GDSL hydrolase family protein [Microcella sp.]|uniref:SGNH/GDSL hydrolase family protein n=1 Tax=Microcella sp. TaxID=1913979 RepID=UPI003F706148
MSAGAASGLTLHFTGDSVTDCGRRTDPDRHLGDGYVRLLSERPDLAGDHVVNTGINGNRVRELTDRWQRDVLATPPDLLSVLVGINDTWRRYDSDDPTSVDEYVEGYARLIDQARAAGVRAIVLCEPFVLPISDEQRAWRDDLNPKIEAVHTLARELGAVLLETDRALTALAAEVGAAAVAADGVHPTVLGHRAIANLWWDATRPVISGLRS